MTSLFRRAAVLALFPLITLPAVADSERWKTIEGWDVGFYEETQGCLAFAEFEETSFFIGYDTSGDRQALDITVLDERWASIRPDVKYPVTLAFGDEAPWTLEMQGVHMDGAPGLNILIDTANATSEVFIEEFQREMRMTWAYAGSELGQFTLKGSRQAFDEVKECQQSWQASLDTAQPADPVGSALSIAVGNATGN